MKTIFERKRVSGILGVIPCTEISFDEEVSNYSFPEKQTLKLKKLMGYEKHRVVLQDSASSDLCIAGLSYLLERGLVRKDEVGAIVVVTVTPDYKLPGTSNIIHGVFDFPATVICMDLCQGCCGYLQGLIQSFMLLDHLENKKVLLFNVDVLSKSVSKMDRNSYPLIGDAASITVVENSEEREKIYFNMYYDGTRRDALIIPAGGSRLPCSAETAILNDSDNDGNLRSLDNLRMSGTDVFEFVQKDVPPMIEETLSFSGFSKEDIDWFLFHQPNKFMLRKLSERIGIPCEKLPMNIVENFGNSSGVCIPVNITFNLKEVFMNETKRCCLSAFGSGLSWGALIMNLGKLEFCELYESSY